ncbi:MAG: YkgJ family cysteine cluster protein, partial [Desulfofustis sp.]|nr:YkgJ family cysteine cluster protein [Desulfofustis sp.]
PFSFGCHPDVACFTRCCHELELAVSPYDVLRIRQATGLSSADVLARYVIIEQETDDIFPRMYLTMVDDGAASCVFLGKNGCLIYHHRPGACRMYPLGRATVKNGTEIDEHFVLLHEPHCLGFHQQQITTAAGYLQSQELAPYNRFNDRLAEITQHDRIKQGLRLSDNQCRAFILALFDLDSFRSGLLAGEIAGEPIGETSLLHDDEALLDYGLRWLARLLFDC